VACPGIFDGRGDYNMLKENTGLNSIENTQKLYNYTKKYIIIPKNT